MRMPPTQRSWLQLTPREFELLVVAELRKLGQPLEDLVVEHQSPIRTPDGEFDIDAVARFKAFGGEYLVVVECKHHKNPIKREVVQVLADKLGAAHAQKAMLFSTTSFQSGALAYAKERRIALIHMTEGVQSSRRVTASGLRGLVARPKLTGSLFETTEEQSIAVGATMISVRSFLMDPANPPMQSTWCTYSDSRPRSE